MVSGSSYAAYVPRNVATPWLGSGTLIGGGLSGPQTGYTTSGTTYYWIAPDPSVTALSLALAPGVLIGPSEFSTIPIPEPLIVPVEFAMQRGT